MFIGKPEKNVSDVISGSAHLNAMSYATKDDAYFTGARQDFVTRLPDECPLGILEIGCGDGTTGALALRSGKCQRYVGVELFPTAADKAREHLSEVLVGDVEEMTLPLEPDSFDAVILSEVLEHLVKPWDVLARIAPLVRPGGMVLASSPNVSHWRVIRELLAGRFELTDRGVFDRTHMRWFTPTSFGEMFDRAGFDVVDIGPVTPFSAKTRLLSRLSGGRLDHLFMTQISFEGRRR